MNPVTLRLVYNHVRLSGDPCRALCGVALTMQEWAFIDLDHARAAVAHRTRRQPCPDCIAATRDADPAAPGQART